jgi:hypothetical protein
MKFALTVTLSLAVLLPARADFSYTTTAKSTGGMMAGFAAAGAGGPGAPRTTRHFVKGDKMKLDSGDTAMIMDFGAQTITHLNHTRKTYSTTPFSQIGTAVNKAGLEVQVDVKDTGERKSINGFNAHQVILTMDMDAPQMRQQAGGGDMKMRMTMDMWISSDVPGAQELRSFYQKAGNRNPWEAMLGNAGGNESMRRAMAEMQKKMSEMSGVAVLTIMKMSMAGNDPRMAQAQEQMAAARAKIEEMQKKGGPQAEMAARMLAQMGGGGAGGPIMEMTTESSNFSTGAIAASEFAVPADYQQAQK